MNTLTYRILQVQLVISSVIDTIIQKNLQKAGMM